MSESSNKVSLGQVLRLVDELSTDEQQQLRRKLNDQSWLQEWQELANEVQEQCKDMAPLSDDEIVQEFKSYRAEQGTKRAQSSD
jgi:hypothetical protein